MRKLRFGEVKVPGHNNQSAAKLESVTHISRLSNYSCFQNTPDFTLVTDDDGKKNFF